MKPMTQRRILLALLLAVVGGEPCHYAVAVDYNSAVCTVDDTRQECLDENVNDISNSVNNESKDNNNSEGGDCIDEAKECRAWADSGECHKNPDYMLHWCRRSCKVCKHEYDSNDFGKPQDIPPHISPDVKAILAKSVTYMKQINADPEYSSINCRNTDERCSQWAIGTGCDDNPKYMKMECAPACQSCDYVLDMAKKCTFDPSDTKKNAIQVGGMDALFERMILKADVANWQPTVLSRPAKKVEMDEDTGAYTSMTSCDEDITNPCNVNVGPWVITLENFVSQEEINTLLKWGSDIGYERSQAGDEIVESRTSSQAWCTEACSSDPIVKSIREKIEQVTGIPDGHYESLQLLHYEPGQYYRPHNDFIEIHTEQSHGPRLLTFFIYFNEVEKGGGTRFPRLADGLTVEPRQGRVLIWPSALDGNLLREDQRTEHEAMEVLKGEKYAANAWIHLRDFQGPFGAGCPS